MKWNALLAVLVFVTSAMGQSASDLNAAIGRPAFADTSSADTVQVGKTLILRPSDAETVRLLQGKTIQPANDWADESKPLVKLTTVGWDPGEHIGLRPSFDLSGVTFDCQFRSAGVLMDRVLGSSFLAVTITRAVGPALMLARCKESNFYSLTITNCLERDSSPVIDFGHPINSRGGKIDGNNHLRFFGGRVNYCNHACYISLKTQPNTSAIRGITFTGFQFHTPPATEKGFRGMPTPDFCKVRDRVLIQTTPKLSRVLFSDCNFTTHGGATDDGHPRVKFRNCSGRAIR